ncbi:MAG TPA: dienelactone hydrolase family protein [Vicinamibacterales bacterium]|nr:dienelactone hydrolase family protein [Vicinamibacterales bacterium]
MNQHRVDLQTEDGTLDTYIFQPAAIARDASAPEHTGPWPAVVMYMDAFGIRPALGDMAQRLASHGYVVALPNLYHRTPFAPFDPKQVAVEGPERARFKGMVAAINGPMVMRDTAALISHLGTQSTVKGSPMGALGYCMGGGYALAAAGTFPDRFAVAASFHGGALATEKPDSPHLLAPKMLARIYIGAAGVDPTFPDEQRQRLQDALDAAGVNYAIETYENAKHGFAVSGHLVYDKDASERHWDRLVRLLHETLH